MKFLARLAAGEVALWCAFWLIGMPLALIWDVSAGCTLIGCGIQDSDAAFLLLAILTLSSLAIPFVAVAIWRSSSRYPRKAWWQTLVAYGAKACAAFSAFTGVVSILILLYMAYIFIYAAFDRA